ncbi:phosphopentomutase [Ruminococcus sp. OA3]|uniref:phosphopentomutase n=1 Tax=Ruminococcus sp. OA3 TaxID=2914164 RepID=UPI001F0620EE|nr:phosphopentomutase [Ruminococcus sp. OA3]MCH1981557.1 phosphopentomutase [Ruminococcus sp. OA3]
MRIKRVFLIVLDSFGIGEMPDAADYKDVGSNTLGTIAASEVYHTPNMKKLGLYNIEGVSCCESENSPAGAFARMKEASRGKDTTIGHWEIAGIISEQAMPTYPEGFPEDVLNTFEKETGRGVLCNRPYSGTEVIKDYGEEHLKSGKLIVYTSADSVFQIAAHEDIIPVKTLYEYCRIAREILQGEHGVGRVIARPFIGKAPDFQRTKNRHDFSLIPPSNTMLDYIKNAGMSVIAVGKINDIFAGKGITKTSSIQNNDDGMRQTEEIAETDFQGLCFVNLVDFDMLYGHRNDIDGYAKAVTRFDSWLGGFLNKMRDEDVLIITGDHGCDPGTPSTDHSREYTPLLVYGKAVRENCDLGTRNSFSDIAATVLEMLGIPGKTGGTGFFNEIKR